MFAMKLSGMGKVFGWERFEIGKKFVLMENFSSFDAILITISSVTWQIWVRAELDWEKHNSVVNGNDMSTTHRKSMLQRSGPSPGSDKCIVDTGDRRGCRETCQLQPTALIGSTRRSTRQSSLLRKETKMIFEDKKVVSRRGKHFSCFPFVNKSMRMAFRLKVLSTVDLCTLWREWSV